MRQKNKWKEEKQHGTFLFPISSYETIVPMELDTPLYYHWHPEIELFYLTSGKVYFQLNAEQILLEKGDILLIKPNVLHGSHTCLKKLVTFRAIVFDSNFMLSPMQDIIEQKYFHTLFDATNIPYLLISQKESIQPILYDLLCKLYTCYQAKENGYELLIKSMLFEFFYYLYPYQKQEINTKAFFHTQKSILLKNIVTYITDHYNQKLTLKQMSKEFAVSEGYFCRFFKSNFHMTFTEYLLGVRIRAAECLLLETDNTMEEIAMKTGFSDSNYFTICFKKVYQDTPSNYRKKSQNFNKSSQDIYGKNDFYSL